MIILAVSINGVPFEEAIPQQDTSLGDLKLLKTLMEEQGLDIAFFASFLREVN